MCEAPDLSRARVLPGDSCGCSRIEGTREAAVDCERLRDRWRECGQGEAYPHALGFPRRELDGCACHEQTGSIDRDAPDRVPGSSCRPHEVEWLARQRSSDRNHGICASHWRGERKTHDGTRLRPRRRSGETRFLCAWSAGKDARKSDRYRKSWFHVVMYIGGM